MTYLLSKETICCSAVTYVAARMRIAEILYNIVTIGRFAGEGVKSLRVSESRFYPHRVVRSLYLLTKKTPTS